MKLSCDVVKDLLPLYHDDVCSEESTAFVKEHLKGCENCRSILLEIDTDLKKPQDYLGNAKPLKTLSFAWKKGKRKSFIKGSLIAVFICSLFMGGFYGLTQVNIIPVPTDLLEVKDVSQMSDGTIIYHLSVKDDKNVRAIRYTINQDGEYFITPERAVIEGKRCTTNGLFNNYFIEDINQISQNNNGTVITAIYIGTKNDNILIWKEGMELPKTSDSLEKTFGNTY